MTGSILNACGRVVTTLYRSEEQSFSILLLQEVESTTRLDWISEEGLRVIGNFPPIVPGTVLSIAGTAQEHKQYGMQFHAECFHVLYNPTQNDGGGEVLESDEDSWWVLTEDVHNRLFSHQIPQIGPQTAKRLWERYQEEALVQIVRYPEEVARHVHRPLRAIETARAYLQTLLFEQTEQAKLNQLPVPGRVRKLMQQIWGEQAWETFYQNPYQLHQPPFGLSLNACESLIQTLKLPISSALRFRTVIDAVLAQRAQQGHTCIMESELLRRVEKLLKTLPFGLDSSPYTPDSLDESSVSSDWKNQTQAILKTYPECKDEQGRIWKYLPILYQAETFLLQCLQDRIKHPLPSILSPEDWRESAHASGLSCTPEQESALASLAKHSIVLLTGGPGTGKTTLLQWICAAYRKRKKTCLLAAPTGRAAKRLQDQTGLEATTLHRLLEVQADKSDETGVQTFLFQRNAENPLEGDVLIVDESSMIDLPLCAALFAAIPSSMRVILVGDQDQLPSVGPGAVFRDWIQSSILPVVRLTQILRQQADSLIVRNSRQILIGKQPHLKQTLDSDWLEIRSDSEFQSSQRLLKFLQEILGVHYQLNPWLDVQILVPIRKGELGVDAMNQRIQRLRQQLQPTPGLTWFGHSFHIGDRVIQMQNHYSHPWIDEEMGLEGVGLFNGERGMVQALDEQSQSLVVQFDDGKRASYSQETQHYLSLCYAMTVHKAQGCEFPAVLLVLPESAYTLQNRSVLYTAVTRAQKYVFLFTVGRSLEQYLQREGMERQTCFQERLQKSCGSIFHREDGQ